MSNRSTKSNKASPQPRVVKAYSLDVAVIDAIKRMAAEEHRSESNMAEKILREGTASKDSKQHQLL